MLEPTEILALHHVLSTYSHIVDARTDAVLEPNDDGTVRALSRALSTFDDGTVAAGTYRRAAPNGRRLADRAPGGCPARGDRSADLSAVTA